MKGVRCEAASGLTVSFPSMAPPSMAPFHGPISVSGHGGREDTPSDFPGYALFFRKTGAAPAGAGPSRRHG